jgi:hypothetical protein
MYETEYPKFEYGEDTFLDVRTCNGISCDYYGCPSFCYAEFPDVKVHVQLIRWTCPKCESVWERILNEDVEKNEYGHLERSDAEQA